jgi:hypothetical protein
MRERRSSVMTGFSKPAGVTPMRLLARQSRSSWISGILCCASLLGGAATWADDPKIPEVLEPWQDWVTWGVEQRDCPTLFSAADQPICFWPSQLNLAADQQGGSWNATVSVFAESWVPLPGKDGVWPMNVRDGDDAVVVVERDGHPAVKLSAGLHPLSGEFRWEEMPQKILIPKQIGILSLAVEDSEIPIPNWDANGEVWLKRARSEPADKDLLNLRVYRMIEDGVPLWLRTEIELTVSGKSREEQLGWILPVGWQIATVESPIPVAIDDRGVIKAQVRAGKWTVAVHAFRTSDPGEFQFAADAEVVAPSELVGLKVNPKFRIAQLENVPTVDVTQTTFPEKWRGLPVYQWDTSQTFSLVEKMRGMGQQSPEGLSIHRRLWLDEDGGGLTYQDRFRGRMQQIWRLDVADGHELGAVRVDGQGQLITANPQTGASGVEIRSRDLNLEAIGRVDRTAELAATGWQVDAESLALTLTLPPGWRVFAIFGADQVMGDWLTAWSLLDLFLLLIFSLAVFRLYGVTAGVIALVAFGLAYHEPGSPRLTWLLLLMPVALLRVVKEGTGKRWIQAWKYVSVVCLLLCLIPFIAIQTQAVIYPQLEPSGTMYGSRGIFGLPSVEYRRAAHIAHSTWAGRLAGPALQDRDDHSAQTLEASKYSRGNLLYDPKSRIQTGPAQPQWEWNDVQCFWNGPVTSQQRIRPILISSSQHRILTLLRLALLMVLAAIVLGASKIRLPFSKRKSVAAASLALLLLPGTASAQFPDRDMLETLRQRVLETPDAFPNAAEIPSLGLVITDGKIEMKAQIHAALEVAVPLPGRFPAWSPLSVRLDGKEDALVSRRGDYLWVLVPQGVHEVVVEGLLPDAPDWDLTFVLKPRYVAIDAPGWRVAGVSVDGVPDDQVFFVKDQESTEGAAAYDRTDFNAIVVVDRYLEIGLVSKVHNTVTRLSLPGKAVSMQVPLLEGESVLTASRDVNDGLIAVQMGATQQSFSWDSELPVGGDIRLNAQPSDQWVERWHLITSPVWNVTLTGLAPIFESDEQDLIPVWHPWAGETVTMTVSRPVAVSGEIVTVQNVKHATTFGSRRRTSKLELDLECSLANDFIIEVDAEADVTSLIIDNQQIPVQRDGARLIVPARPGRQSVTVEWKSSELMDTVVLASDVKLPTEASNITTLMRMPENRWILWADGPLRGPAVRFWTILAIAILAALALGSIPHSPLKRWEWVLLAIGLTQVHLMAAMLVVSWLFLLAWRGRRTEFTVRRWAFNLLQLGIVLLTFAALTVLIVVVSQGLLGNPDMFIVGNGSSQTYLQWFQPRVGPQLPMTSVVSISVWFYRLLMLCWALWLASALLNWLSWGWKQFSHGEAWRKKPRREAIPVAQQG